MEQQKLCLFIKKIQNSDVCIKAPVGQTAASVIVKLRQLLSLYANVRPAVNLPNVDSIGKNVDLVIVRENTEDLYKGYEFTADDVAVAMRVISKKACYKISEYAFQLAELRNKKRQVVAIHKNNVLKETCGLFLKTANQVSKNYSNIKFYWLMGADNLVNFHQWQNWRKFFNEISIVIFKRHGYNNAALKSIASKAFENYYIKSKRLDQTQFTSLPSWTFVQNKEIRISSTEIRKQRALLRR